MRKVELSWCGLLCPEPGEQGVDLVDGMICDAPEDICEVGFGIEAVHFCGRGDGVEASSPLASGVGTTKKVIPPSM